MMLSKPLKLSLILVLATVAIYVQVISHGFIHYDDYGYVVANEHVNTGLIAENLVWAFTEVHFSNWHPLTWISHMVDVELFGLDAGGHHVVNLLLHISNGLLLFYFLLRTTAKVYPAFIVALLFLIHPAHVESVAWVAERKDVLSTFFFLLTIIAYSFYTESRTIRNYLVVLCFLFMGLMSKPMVVTLPFVMLLLDIWPLRRVNTDNFSINHLLKLVIEKIPFFVAIIGSAILTYIIQKQSGAMNTSLVVDIVSRFENAFVSYIRYLWMAFYPGTLTIFYPHPSEWDLWKVIASCCSLLVISAIAIYKIRTAPWLFVGWFFFLGTLVPVIGIVQVGIQSIAERYTYIPYIGIFVIVAWVLDWIIRRYSEYKKLVVSVMIFFSMALALQAYHYLSYWKYDALLFRHALETHDPGYHDVLKRNGKEAQSREVYGGLYVMYQNMGIALYTVELFEEAKVHFIEAVRILPSKAEPRYMLGETYFSTGHYELAYHYISMAMELDLDRRSDYLKRLSDIELLLLVKNSSGDSPER